MINDRCLPIVYRNGDSPRHYCDYWTNYCGGFPVIVTTNYVTELESVWGGKLYDVINIGHDDVPYIEFDTAEQLTTFLLRWS